MLLAGRTRNHITRPDDHGLFAPTLRNAESGGNYQGLAERMRVPRCACAGLKSDARARGSSGLARLKQRVDSDAAAEPFGRPSTRGLRTASLDFHGSRLR